jgi:hypothetical protein
MPAHADSIGSDYLVSQTFAQGLPTDDQVQPKAKGTRSKTPVVAATPTSSEQGANSMQLPPHILSTGTDIHKPNLSPNAQQLADELGLTPLYARLDRVRNATGRASADERLDALESREVISEKLRRAEMEVNFVLAEIYDEQSLYNEVLSSYTGERDKIVAMTNAVSFGTNGILWAVAEGLDIPTYRYPHLSVSSGVTGIVAGVIPSVASAMTLKEVNGRKHSEPADPNMLAKLFDRPITARNDYPDGVWTFLDTIPADDPKGKKRKDQMIDRWIADKNLPSFTDRGSSSQIDLITNSEPQKKTVTISVLSTRLSLLSQLAAETFKMNRLLLELEMALDGSKHA